MHSVINCLFAISCALCLICVADEDDSAPERGSDDADILVDKVPPKRPEVDGMAVESARRDKMLKEFAASHAKIQSMYKELEERELSADPKAERQNKLNAERIRRRIKTERTTHRRMYLTLKRPLAHEFNNLNDKYRKLKGDEAAARAQDNEKRAERAVVELDKVSSRMDLVKAKIDLLDYFMFFEGDKESEEDDEDDAEENSKDKKRKDRKERKERKNKKKSKDDK